MSKNCWNAESVHSLHFKAFSAENWTILQYMSYNVKLISKSLPRSFKSTSFWKLSQKILMKTQFSRKVSFWTKKAIAMFRYSLNIFFGAVSVCSASTHVFFSHVFFSLTVLFFMWRRVNDIIIEFYDGAWLCVCCYLLYSWDYSNNKYSMWNDVPLVTSTDVCDCENAWNFLHAPHFLKLRGRMK